LVGAEITIDMLFISFGMRCAVELLLYCKIISGGTEVDFNETYVVATSETTILP
jgi:hypothetical protein